MRQLSGTDHLTPLHGISDFSQSAARYPKTLFRFPLRNAASGLSANLYNIQKVNELIEALRSEAKLLLLFLRSVHTIEVYNIDNFGKSTLSFQTKIADAFVQGFKQKRTSFLQELKSCHASQQYNFSRVISFTCKFDVCVYDANTRQSTTSQWLVANRIDSTNVIVRAASVKQKVFPWVGTAVELENPGKGRIFCVLPMPIETASNLPVHVNGTFGINDDRRNLKWPGVERKNDPMADWNQMLVRHVIPPCYINLLLEAKLHLQKNFYRAWPDVECLRHTQWEAVLSLVFSALWEKDVILSESGWVSPSAAVYAPKSGRQIAQVVKTALTNCNVKMAEVPASVWNAFSYTRKSVTEINPTFVRDTLRTSPASYVNFNHSHKLELLKYCLSDGQYYRNQLINLQLLPLASGSFVAFQVNSPYISIVYICTAQCPRELLSNLDHKLVVQSDDSDLQTKLLQVAGSNTTQLKVLDVSAVSTLLDEAMPSSWRNTKTVSLPDGQFRLEWFQTFWTWLKNKQLSAFQNKFIFPVHCGTVPITTRFSVVRLLQSQPVLYVPSYTEYSNTMLSVLTKFGIQYCTQANFPYVEHRQLTKFVKTYSAKALLELITAKGSFASVNLSPEEAQFLKNAFSQISLSQRDCTVLQDLQIFLSCANTSSSLYSINDVIRQSLLRKVLVQPSKSIDLAVLPANVIVFSSQDYYQVQLLNKLGGHSASNDVTFLTDNILPHLKSIGEGYIDGIMTRVLDMYQSLCYTSNEITTALQNLQFVKVASGGRKRPSDLFDPHDECITNILKGENVFPSEPYNASKYISTLKLCGLHTSVTPQKILDVIYSISLPYSSSPQVVDETKMHQSKAILQYIASSGFNFSGSYKINSKIERGQVPFPTALMLLSSNRSWLPVLPERPSNYPSCLPWKGEGYTSHFISLNGSACVYSSSSPSLPLVYGSQAYFTHPCGHLESDTPVQCLVSHFKHIIASKEDISSDQMMPIVSEVYLAMLGVLQEGSNVDVLNKLKTMKEWVYIKKHHKFVSVGSVALRPNSSFGHHVEPYLYILPDSISAYSQLFQHFGMKDSISRSQIVSMLGLIKEEIYVSPSSVSQEAAWSTVMAILNWITENGTKKVGSDSLFVPVESSSKWPDLKERNETVYADGEFLKNFISSSEIGSSLTFVHSRINQSLAMCLGITPLSEELDVSEDTFEDAGQYEPLVIRLKNILRDYKDGLTIVKELIQNADDAEATEVNICFDARTHTTDKAKLFFPDMCESHGPALVIQNNTTFSDEDFVNIQKLAGAAKQNKHLKIGKFGVGFCSVYHITDVPSFVSRERLYIFDPTLRHLRKAVKNPSQPGKKVDYLSKIIATSKQMEPYDGLFGFNHNTEYQGTIFRLPFRKCPSELSTTCYSESTVGDLVESIQECGDKLLLFLQHVKRITVQRFDTGKSSPDILYELHKPTIPQALSLENTSLVAVKSTGQSQSASITNWLVATHEATDRDKKAVANVACLLSGSANAYTICDNLAGEVFCFLPLSKKSGLPVHVSCNFAVFNNRRGIWTSESTTNSSVGDPADEVQWNVFLMNKVIPVAYMRLLCSLMTMFEKNFLQNYKFYCLWPLSSKLQQKNPWEKFVEALYNLLLNLKLFYSESTSKWLTFRESKFLDTDMFGHSDTLSCILEVLHHLQQPLVDLPSSHREHLNLSNELLKEASITEIFFDNLSELKAVHSSRNEIVYHLLKTYASQGDTKPHICQLIKRNVDSFSCIPTTPDGTMLRKCTEIIDPRASFSKLFDEDDHRFPIKRLTDDLSLTALKHAGMMHSSLPWELIIDRAQSVNAVLQTDHLKALERVRLILSTMSTSVSGEPPSSGPTIDSIPFLPVVKKPEGYPLDWHGDNYQLLSGKQLVLCNKGTNLSLAGSQVAYLCEDSPDKGGCDTIYINRTKELLHLRKQPTLDEVISHLRVIIDCFNSDNSPDPSWINQSYKEIYSFFESLLEHDGPRIRLERIEKHSLHLEWEDLLGG